jgi:hypothetical protein
MSSVSGPSESRVRWLILLSGTAGSGKRTIAGLLAAERGFVHVEFPVGTERARARLSTKVDQLLDEDERGLIVVCPSPSADLVACLRSYGFDWVWFDSDHGAAWQLARCWDADLDVLGAPRFVRTFEVDGSFRPLADVAAELLTDQAAALALSSPRQLQSR